VPTNNCFIWLVLDKQCNGAAATAGGTDTSIFTSTLASTALVNLANGDRFRILKKFVFNLTSAAGVSGAYGNVAKFDECYLRVNIPIEFDPSLDTGALTTIRSNNIFLVAGADNGDDLASFQGSCRIRYADN